MKARTLLVVLGLAVGVPLMVGALTALSLRVGLPERQGDRARGPHGLVGVWTGRSYAWIVPAGGGVVLVDAGSDRSASALRAELAGREVLATLLTHGHVDHASGVDAFPDAPLYLGSGDRSLAAGERLPGGVAAAWWARASEVPRLPATVQEVQDTDVLEIGTERFRVVEVPGHTRGSVAYRWREVLFVGDALMAGDPIQLPPELLADDPGKARDSLAQLLPLAFEWLADGHVGVRGEGRSALHAFLEQAVEEPTVALEAEGELTAAIEVHGRYVQRPVPDAQGLQPARIVADDGQVWVVATQPQPAHASWWQRRVRVVGRPVVEPAGWRPVGGAWLDVEAIEAVDEAPAGVRRVALGSLAAHDQAWVQVVGPLRGLEPLAAGAARAQGQLGEVEVIAPSSARPWVGSVVTALARVDGEVLLVEAVCPGDVPVCPEAPLAP